MKHCTSCGQILAQGIATCPACGSSLIAGIKAIDDYQIQAIIHEGRSSLVCRAIQKGKKTPVTLRLFTDQSGVDQKIAARLEEELNTLDKLPQDLFVRHYAICQSSTGHWYRVSEWVDADNWGSIFVSGLLKDQRRMVTLFYNIASALACLHRHDHFMPYLILEDILLPKDNRKSLAVKINYKLSRFLNARATHHGPMLKKLLKYHPDIVNKRAIDFRTGIWSLGKIFIELLTADHNLTRFSSRVDQIKGLDQELAVLLKIMLSDDPDLRPQSMDKVVSVLGKILEHLPSKPIDRAMDRQRPRMYREIIRFKRTMAVLIILIIGYAAVTTFFYYTEKPGREEERFTQFLESHTRSIGFLMVEYWLKDQDRILYKNKVEGTAFLVDEKGYLLTNRHVACPWLEDAVLFRIRARLKEKNLELGHRMFLWFKGAKAFNRFQGFDQSADLADLYYLAGAFKSEGKSNLRVVGVPMGFYRPGNRIHSPFQQDFAVLKIDTLPERLHALPMETRQDPEDIKRLSPVIIMGFPLGSQTQDERINASITRGHVRRTSRELIQVDSSIYKGNSGGPAVNEKGRVIGIASGVVIDQPSTRNPLHTPLSDFGLVLPILEPAKFVQSLKAGKPKWDGFLDFTLEKKLDQVLALANTQDYLNAAQLAHTLLETSQDPALIFTTALLDFCENNLNSSRALFTRLISIEGENMMSRLMLYIIDWLTLGDNSQDLTQPLFSINWQHSDEFIGYLARTLNSKQMINPSIMDYENPSEKAWRFFIQGLILEKQNKIGRAMSIYKEIVLASGASDHLYFMSFSRLNTLMDREAVFTRTRQEHLGRQNRLWEKARQQRLQAKEKYAKSLALVQTFESLKTDQAPKEAAIESLIALSPDNRTIMGRAAFFYAAESQWEKALDLIDLYFKVPARDPPLSLSLGLLKGQMLKMQGRMDDARQHLIKFQDSTHAPWYRILIKRLLADAKEETLIKLAAKSPARLITLHTALGMDAEAGKDLKKAALHYREALGTYLESWNEYDLARARLLGFRQVN
ncbi:MAG: trypsin-like peptidase domain-containing protein [Desulfobacter sp.]|nr:trypsin-like peptidase domain-containing protein [Desulfobacter sp.]